jgi:aminoglycoside phosphotransferase (APT) family kinase protein
MRNATDAHFSLGSIAQTCDCGHAVQRHAAQQELPDLLLRWPACLPLQGQAPMREMEQLHGWLEANIPPTDADPAATRISHGDFRWGR